MSQTIATPNPEILLFRCVLDRRICAFIIDAFLIGVFGWACAFGIFMFSILTLGIGFLMFHIVPFVPFIYYTLLAPTGTPGQRLFGIALRQDSDLIAPNYAQAFVWSLLLWLSFVLAGLPFLLALAGPRHRAGHDLLAGLVIIRRA
jgi:uncharacterized RDD family membrane protein YckC